MPSEIDPLLPQTDPSPEISGYGFSRPRRPQDAPKIKFLEDTLQEDPRYEEQEDPRYEEVDDAGDANETRSATSANVAARSALSTCCGIFIIVIAFALFLVVLAPGSPWGNEPSPEPVPDRPGRTIDERVSDILERTPLIDGHNDLAILLRFIYKNQIHTSSFHNRFEDGGMEQHVDLPRLQEGKVGGTFWSAFVPCTANASYDFSDAQYSEAVSTTLSQIDLIRRLQGYYPNTFTPAGSSLSYALDMFHVKKSIISPISIEGLHQVPQSEPMSTLRLYYTLGVRAATLTWNCHNAFADAAMISNASGTHPAPYHRGGLTSAGRDVIREMNRLGMLIDLSHTSYWTQKAVLSNHTSAAPVLFTHSSAFTLCAHPRNVHDNILDLVKETNSLVMINFSPDFISCLAPPNASVLPEFYEPNNTLHQVARHVVYVGEKIGYDHVGFGSDFDGIEMTPRGLDGVDKFPALVAELLRMGVKDADASKVVGGNLLRVWRAAETAAQRMKNDGVLEGEDPVQKWGTTGV